MNAWSRRFFRSRDHEKAAGLDPRQHEREELLGLRHGLGGGDLAGLRLALLDPTAQCERVLEGEGTDGGALEVMATLPGFDQENPGLGADHRDRETGKARAGAQIRHGARIRRKLPQEGQRIQDQPLRDLRCGSVTGQVDPRVPALDQARETGQLGARRCGAGQSQFGQAGVEDRLDLAQSGIPRSETERSKARRSPKRST
jgi:hypothetical protein